jgi:hypothetical protein
VYPSELRRSSNRIKAKRREKPLVKEAEAFVCMNLRMIKDGQVVTAPKTWRWKLPCSNAAGRLLPAHGAQPCSSVSNFFPCNSLSLCVCLNCCC